LELIFITYVNRSGSTLLANLLNKSEEVLVCPEAEVLVNEFLVNPKKRFQYDYFARERIRKFKIYDDKLKFWYLNSSDLTFLKDCETNFDTFVQILKVYRDRIKPNANKVIFKAERIIQLVRFFPEDIIQKYNIRIIAIIRDPRGVYSSQKENLFLGKQRYMSKNPVKTAIFWKKFILKCTSFKRTENFIIIKFENLINDVDKTILKLSNSLKLNKYDNNESNMDLYERIPENQKYLHINITKSPITDKIWDWHSKLSAKDILLIEVFTRKELLNYNYNLVSPHINKFFFLLLLIFYSVTYYWILVYLKITNKVITVYDRLNDQFFIKVKYLIIYFLKYFKSSFWGFLQKREFSSVKNFLIFIGYPRSGHSMIGALIDAHPNAIVGMEVDVLKLVGMGFKKKQLFHAIRRNSKLFKNKLNNTWTGYSYKVPRQFQGMAKRLEVIGDKKGGKSTNRIAEDWDILDKFQSLLNCKIKILHVIRNPFDNISTMILRNLPESGIVTRELFLSKIDLYFNNAFINNKIKQQTKFDILDIYHEKIIKNPQEILKKILTFLELDLDENYINDCSRIIYKNTHKSRFEINWSKDLIDKVYFKIQKYPFLSRYSYYD